MRAFLHSLLFLALCIPSPAATKAAEENDDSWMQHYYLHPRPQRFEAEVLKMQATGALVNDGAVPPLASFFSRLFHTATPEQFAAWMRFTGTLKGKERQVFLLALHWAATPAAKGALRTIADGRGEAAAYAGELIGAAAPDMRKFTEPAPEELDMCWGAFFATGDAEFVLPIIRCAARTEKPDTVDPSHQAAQWSLKSLCRSHDKLIEIKDKFRETATPAERKTLDELFKE